MLNLQRRFSDTIANLSTSIIISDHSPTRFSKSDKLQAIFDRQKANFQLLIMNNRIAKLEKAKKTAEKEIFEAKKNAKLAKFQILNKSKEADDKFSYFHDQQEKIENLRKKFKKQRQQRKKNIKSFEKKILREKQKIVNEKKEKSKE